VAPPLLRIFSDLHFGDHASSLTQLAALTPLLDGADQIVLNGDTIDTRPSRDPTATAALRAETLAFFNHQQVPVIMLTGNHDPDLSAQHALELANRRVFVTHGDILFDDVVPWGRDSAMLRARFAAELAALSPEARERLDDRLAAMRRATAAIPQRHQSERHRLKYLLGFLADTIWPPTRVLRVLRAWRETPSRAVAVVRRHHLPAKFFVMGHTHRAGAIRTRAGLTIVNTGSFCPPGAAAVVDLTPDRLSLRQVERNSSEFHLGRTLAEFALADA
jgi:UDP-2,3-diacylglucosamine pyrophosphatase LpxH